MAIRIEAFAKINLVIDVLGKREDGYHEVEMIMQSINLADRLSFSRRKSGIKIQADNSRLPTGKENLVYQALELLKAEFEVEEGIEVQITKDIPLAAGLAGGSTNAAAALVAGNKLWKLGLTEQKLMELGARLGADIPFCLVGGTKLAQGKGTEIREIDQAPKLELVVVNPPFGISTAEVYKNFGGPFKTGAVNRLKPALKNKDKKRTFSNLENNLALSACQLYPEVEKLKNLVAEKTEKAIVSGSGPTVLGFTHTKEQANRAANKLAEELGSKYQIKKAETVDFGWRDKG